MNKLKPLINKHRDPLISGFKQISSNSVPFVCVTSKRGLGNNNSLIITNYYWIIMSWCGAFLERDIWWALYKNNYTKTFVSVFNYPSIIRFTMRMWAEMSTRIKWTLLVLIILSIEQRRWEGVLSFNFPRECGVLLYLSTMYKRASSGSWLA